MKRRGHGMKEINLYYILKKMFKTGGYRWDTINFTIDNWWYHYAWTEKQEKKFMKWLIKYYIKSGHINPKMDAQMFNLSYGLRTVK